MCEWIQLTRNIQNKKVYGKEKHSLSSSKGAAVSIIIKRRSPAGSDKLCLALCSAL